MKYLKTGLGSLILLALLSFSAQAGTLPVQGGGGGGSGMAVGSFFTPVPVSAPIATGAQMNVDIPDSGSTTQTNVDIPDSGSATTEGNQENVDIPDSNAESDNNDTSDDNNRHK